MRVFIQKYKGDNFFSLDKIQIDWIVMNNCLLEGFPLFSEEMVSEDNWFKRQVGDFTIRFSLLQPELSNNNKDIRDFFFTDNEQVKFYCSLEPFANDSYLNRRCGIITNSSIKVDTTITQNKYDLEFSVISIEKEFVSFQSPFVKPNVDVTVDYFLSFLGANIVDVQNELHLENIFNFPIYVQTRLLGMTNVNIYATKLMTELIEGLGATYKIYDFTSDFTHRNRVLRIRIFWKDIGNNSVDLKEITNIESYAVPYLDTKYMIYALGVWEANFNVGGVEQRNFFYWGIFMDNTGDFYTNMNSIINFPHNNYPPDKNAIIYNTLNETVSVRRGGSNITTYNKSDVTIFIPFRYRNSETYVIPLGSVTRTVPIDWHPAAWLFNSENVHIFDVDSVLTNTFIPQNRFLFSINKLNKVKKVKFDRNFPFVIYQNFQDNNKQFWINRISDLDLNKETAEIEAIEI